MQPNQKVITTANSNLNLSSYSAFYPQWDGKMSISFQAE